MADFSFISDGSSDEGAVEELLNQAMDHSVLQQIAALNLSSFASDSVLPTHLETRFRSLKSFPSKTPSKNSKLPSLTPLTPKSKKKNSLSVSDDENDRNPFEGNGLESKSGSGSSSSRSEARRWEELDPDAKKGSNSNARSGSGSSRSKARCGEELDPDGKRGSNSKAQSGRSFLSPSDSSNSSMTNSPSPPRKTGCFWCSPKSASNKKRSKGNIGDMGFGDYWRRNNKEILSDLSVFSVKEQQKMLKMAMKEEEKVNREAEKIVKYAKQASARMNVPDIEDELSESENHK